MSSTHVVVDSLEEMENIVEANHSLEWDGWDVVFLTNRRTSFMRPDAVFKNGRWQKVVRYPVKEIGWTLPSGLVHVAE